MPTDQSFWITNGRLIVPDGERRGALCIRNGRIAAIRPSVPRGARTLSARGQWIAPGFVDLHIWGDPAVVAREAVKGGTTAFLTAIGPEAPEKLIEKLAGLGPSSELDGARCLGAHLEGPFVNPAQAGALPPKWMRPVVAKELTQLLRHAAAIKVITLAPELPGALEAIPKLTRRGIAVSLGHSRADADTVSRAAAAGATLVTHLFNGMRPLHHREPGLLGAALMDPRLTAMVILDGVHISTDAFRLALLCKGVDRLILETDSIRHQRPLRASYERGAYYVPRPAWNAGKPTLAGSGLTMIEAVRNAVRFAKISLGDAVRMASLHPARAIRQAGRFGAITVGRPADVVCFDEAFRVTRTLIAGRVVYQR